MAAMANDDQLGRPAPDVSEPGVPAIEEVGEEILATGDIKEGEMPPLDHPQGVEEYGTTAVEERQPESLEDRLAREQPDVEAPAQAAMRPVAPPDSAPGLVDPDSDLLGDEDTLDEDTLAPEEAALRQTEDLPGATYDRSPGYLEEG